MFGGTGGASLRVPPSDEIGVPLGLSVTRVLDGSSTKLVWNRNDDTGVAFPAATPVAFADQTCTLNADHDTLQPDTGWYRLLTRVTFLSTGATLINMSTGGWRNNESIPLPDGETTLVWTDILPLYLDNVYVTPYLRTGSACSVTGATLYAWRLNS